MVSNSTDYLLSVRRDPLTFDWRLENLSDNTVQTDSSDNGGNSSGTGLFDIGGSSTYSAAGSQSSNLVVITSVADADVLTIETYLKQYYRGPLSVAGGGRAARQVLLRTGNSRNTLKMSDYVMIYEHNGEVTALPKPPPPPKSRMIRAVAYVLSSLHTIIRVMQKTL